MTSDKAKSDFITTKTIGSGAKGRPTVQVTRNNKQAIGQNEYRILNSNSIGIQTLDQEENQDISKTKDNENENQERLDEVFIDFQISNNESISKLENLEKVENLKCSADVDTDDPSFSSESPSEILQTIQAHQTKKEKFQLNISNSKLEKIFDAREQFFYHGNYLKDFGLDKSSQTKFWNFLQMYTLF